MPIYEYHCMDCGHRFEELQKFSEKDIVIECPKCKSTNTRKTVSNFGTTGSSGSSASSSNAGGCKFG